MGTRRRHLDRDRQFTPDEADALTRNAHEAEQPGHAAQLVIEPSDFGSAIALDRLDRLVLPMLDDAHVPKRTVSSVTPPNDDVSGLRFFHKETARKSVSMERSGSDEVGKGRDGTVDPCRFAQAPGHECGAPGLGWSNTARLEVLLDKRAQVVAPDFLCSGLQFLLGDPHHRSPNRHTLVVAGRGSCQPMAKAGRRL